MQGHLPRVHPEVNKYTIHLLKMHNINLKTNNVTSNIFPRIISPTKNTSI